MGTFCTKSVWEVPAQTFWIHPSFAFSFDHLVGEREQRRRNLQAQRLGGAQIDDKMKLGLLQDRQVCRFLALENPAAVDAGLPERIGPVRSVAHQSPGLRKDAID